MFDIPTFVQRAKALVVAAAALAAIPSLAPAQPYPAQDRAHITAIENGLLPAVVIKGRPLPTETLASRMAATKTPGVSITFFENGRIRWAKAYGLADIASGRPVTPQTLFQAASISKAVTATAAMRLVQDGRLNLDDDVNLGLKSWKLPDSAFTTHRKVTLRELLSHTAGLRGFSIPGYGPGLALPSTIQILNGEAPANTPAVVSDTEPGQRYLYANGGYIIVELLMTDATGEAFPDLMRELVLDPAHMASSAYDQPLPLALAARAATGYFINGQPLPGGRYTYPELGPAGLWTTPSDLARFAIALQNARTGSSQGILAKATALGMMTRRLNDFGLGLNLGPPDGPAMFQHGGSNQGFQADLHAFTGGSRQGVAIMTNGDGGRILIPDILRAVSKAYGWRIERPREVEIARLSPAQLAAPTGIYEIPGVATFTVTAEDGRLYGTAAALGPARFELLPETPTRFFVLANGMTAAFAKDPDGVIRKVAIGGPFGDFQAVRRH
jgi:CubicO group peptidase (beta-lactamase class C family)